MTGAAWVRLDNASNIFLAARTDADTKVFRMSAEMDHDVDPVLLQQALDHTYDRYPLYHSVLRSGVFWYYLQQSTLRPRVMPDELPTCAAIYQDGRRNLLFRIIHHERRIALEIFHALSDGTGALWFLTDLITAYVRLRGGEPAHVEAASAEVEAPKPDPAADDGSLTVHGLTTDSFAHYFRRRRSKVEPTASEEEFRLSAKLPSALNTEVKETAREDREQTADGRVPRPKVFRVRGTRNPDNRTRAVELTMPAKEVLALAKAEGASPSMFLTALFFESIRLSSGGLGRARTMAASVPVNLRQFFPSTSARNFFATVRVQHTYGEGPDDLGSICRNLEQQFRPKATPAALERKLRRLIRLERSPILRIVPRPLKNVILALINWGNNRGLTVAISNLGRVHLPEVAEPHVKRMYFHVSAARPQFCAISHAGQLAISFTSPFSQTDHIREYARLLTERGIDVTVAAARVTEAELTMAAT